MKKLFKFLIKLLLTIVILISIGYVAFRYWPNQSTKNTPTDYTITATELIQEFDSNNDNANKKFIGKTIQVKGTISEISKDQNNATVIILNQNFSGVLCTFVATEGKKLVKYKIGNELTVKGTCSGILFEVVLKNCIVIE